MDNKTLASVINTLNEIEVRGKDNLDMLLGCILTLEKLDLGVTEEPIEKNEVEQ